MPLTRDVSGMSRILQVAGAVLVLSSLPGLAPNFLQAQDVDSSKSFRIGANLAGAFFLSDIDVPPQYQDALASTSFSQTVGVGLEAGQRLSPRWEIEAHLLTAFNSDLTITTVGGQAVSVEKSIASVGVSAVYYLLEGTPVQPFVLAGAGTRTTDLKTLTGGNPNFDPTVNLGGGVAAPVTDRFSVRFAARDLVSWYNEITQYDTAIQHDLYLSAGGYLHF